MDPNPGNPKHTDHQDSQQCTKLTLSMAGSLTDIMAVGGLGVGGTPRHWAGVKSCSQHKHGSVDGPSFYTLSESLGGNLSVSPPNHSTHTAAASQNEFFFLLPIGI
jgi:hypothetical protein